MRTIVIKGDTTLQDLSKRLLDQRLGAQKAEAALAELKALNPHVDLEKLAPGTLLFVPNAPGFTSSSTDSPTAEPQDDFLKLLQGALRVAAADLEAGLVARAKERADVSTALRSTA